MSVSSINEKKTDPILIEDDNDDDSNDEPEPLQRSAACTFNPNFQRPTPPPKESIYSDDDDSDDGFDLLDLFEMWYGDLYRDGTLNEKIPRSRLHYEYTGRVDKVFKGDKKMLVKIPDISDILKFSDDSKRTVKLNDPTNKLVLAYQNKKVKRLVSTASSISTCPTFGVIINNEQVGLTISSNNNAPTTSKEAERQTEQPAPPKKKNLFATLKNKELLRAKLKASLNKKEYIE